MVLSFGFVAYIYFISGCVTCNYIRSTVYTVKQVQSLFDFVKVKQKNKKKVIIKHKEQLVVEVKMNKFKLLQIFHLYLKIKLYL